MRWVLSTQRAIEIEKQGRQRDGLPRRSVSDLFQGIYCGG